MAYLPTPIQERNEDRSYLPRIIMLADKKSGLPLNQHIAKPDEDIKKVIIEMIAGYIEKHGRPSTIYVRNEQTGCYIEDLCQKLEIKLIKGKGMPVINAILEVMLNFMN